MTIVARLSINRWLEHWTLYPLTRSLIGKTHRYSRLEHPSHRKIIITQCYTHRRTMVTKRWTRFQRMNKLLEMWLIAQNSLQMSALATRKWPGKRTQGINIQPMWHIELASQQSHSKSRYRLTWADWIWRQEKRLSPKKISYSKPSKMRQLVIASMSPLTSLLSVKIKLLVDSQQLEVPRGMTSYLRWLSRRCATIRLTQSSSNRVSSCAWSRMASAGSQFRQM